MISTIRLKKVLVTTGFLLSVFSLTSQEIGLQLYSLRNEFKQDIPGTFAKIKEWGITKVEDGNDGTQGYTMQDYKTLLADHNIDIVSASASFEELKTNPEKALERALAYGSKYIVCFWIPHKGTDFNLKDANKALKVFNSAGKIFKEKGITLAYHPHGYEFGKYKDMTLMDYIIQEADYFDFEMDVYWFALPGEDPITWLRRYPDKFILMHLKDCEQGIGISHTGQSDVETNVILGDGQIDIAVIVEEAKKMKIEYLFIEDESSKSLEQIPQSLHFLKQLK